MDEKRCCARFGVTCVTGYSDPIHTRDFDSFEKFFAALQTAWDKIWVEVFSADPASKIGLRGLGHTDILGAQGGRASKGVQMLIGVIKQRCY